MAVFSGNGAVGSPSFTFSSDTNTGIYRPDADQLAIVANGAQQALFTTTTNTLNGQLNNNGVIYYNGSDVSNGGFYGIDEGQWVTTNTEFQLIRTRNGAGVWGRKGSSNNQGSLIFKTHTTLAAPVTRGGFTEGGSFVVGGTFPSSPAITLSSNGNISAAEVYPTAIGMGGMRMSAANKSLSLNGSAQDAFRLNLNNGHGSAEITAMAQDSNYPNGASIQKLYLAWRGNGAEITSITLAVENKASINNGPAGFPGTWTATLNGTGGGNDIDLEYTGTSGETRYLQVFCIASAGTIAAI